MLQEPGHPQSYDPEDCFPAYVLAIGEGQHEDYL